MTRTVYRFGIHAVFLMPLWFTALGGGAQSPNPQKPQIRATGSDLPSLSTQIPLVDACSAASANDQPPVSVRWHYQKQSNSPTPWIRVHLNVNDSAPHAWKIEIRSGGGELRETISSDDLADGAIWSAEIPGSVVSVDLISDNRIATQVCADFISVKSSQAGLSSKALTSSDGKDRRVVVAAGVQGYNFRNPVAIVWFLQPDGTKTNCSGVALTSVDVMTNYHCLSAAKQLRNAEVWFSYEAGQQYIARKAVRFTVTPNRDLDFSIVKLDSPLPSSFVASVSTKSVELTDGLMLMQHPDGLQKMTVTVGCVLKAESAPDTVVANSDYAHMCDSSGGSSGSPLMDMNGNVIGLHHLEEYDDHTKGYYNMALKTQVLINSLNQTQEGRQLVGQMTILQ